MISLACELRPGDVIWQPGYPADLIAVERLPTGVVALRWGVDDGDVAMVAPWAEIEVLGRVDV